MTKRVLIAINSSWNIYNFRASLIRELKMAGYQVISAAPRDAYTERLRAMVDEHIDLPMQNAGTSLIHDFALFLRYLRVLGAAKPDVMLSYTIKPNIYGAFAARFLGIPAIANVSGLGTAFIRDNWLTRLVKLLYRMAFSGVACVFFQNMEDRDLFVGMKLLALEKTKLLPGSGVDLDYFHPRHGMAKDSSKPLAFVLIARMLWDKGIGEYVEAARIVKAKHPEVAFHLVGQKDVQNKTAIPSATIEAWDAEGIVQYLGETDQIREMIAQHDCVVLPSYREGMSRVLLEAAAMGKPLIATDVPGCRQVVDHERNGLLCQLRDVEDLATMMCRFVEYSAQERAQMGVASRVKAEREFDEKLVFTAYLNQIAAVTQAS